jgi:hypothetical protein
MMRDEPGFSSPLLSPARRRKILRVVESELLPHGGPRTLAPGRLAYCRALLRGLELHLSGACLRTVLQRAYDAHRAKLAPRRPAAMHFCE